MLDFQTAAQQTAIATAAGFTKNQIVELSEGAKLASVTLGRDLTDSFNRLIRGVTKAEPELLDELGIILRLDIATRSFAAANGLVAEKLTIGERRLAVFEEVQRQLINNFGAMQDEANEFLNPFSKLSVAVQDLVIELQKLPLGAFSSLVEFLTRNIGALMVVMTMFASSIISQIVPSLGNMKQSFLDVSVAATNQQKSLKANVNVQKAKIKEIESKFIASEAKKNIMFKKELKRRGITQKSFNAMTIADQKKLIQKMIMEDKKGVSATGRANKQRQASYQAMFKKIELASAKSAKTLGAHARIMGANLMMMVRQPAILTSRAIGAIGTAAVAAAPKLALLGSIFNATLGIAMAFFTLKFVVDFLPGIQKINEALDKMKEKLKASQVVLTEMAFSFDERLLNSKLESIKESFFKSDGSVDSIAGALRAANAELEYFGKLTGNLELGMNEKAFKKYIDKITMETIRDMGDSGLVSAFGGTMNALSASGGAVQTVPQMLDPNYKMVTQDSAALQAASELMASRLLENVALAMRTGDTVKARDLLATAFGDTIADSAMEGFAEAKGSSRAMAGLMEDLQQELGDNPLKIFEFDFVNNEITGLRENFILALRKANDLVAAINRVPGILSGTREASKSLAEAFGQQIPKPSTIEKNANQIETILNEFVDKKGNIKDLNSEELKLTASIVSVLEDELAIKALTAEQAKDILEAEKERLRLVDFRLDTFKTLMALSKAEMNNLKFVNTRTSKRYQTEQKIFDLRMQMQNNIDKEEQKFSKLVKYGTDQQNNIDRQADGVRAVNRELEVQVELLEASLHRTEMLMKGLLETFDSSAAKNLATLIDTANLGEFGGKEFMKNLAEDLKKTAAKSLAEGMVDSVTDKLTPARFKLNKKLDPAQKIMAAHKYHIDSLADILNQHAKAIGSSLGVSSSGLDPTDPNQMTYGGLFGGDKTNLEGGFVDTIKGKLSGMKDFIFGKKGQVYSGFDHAAVLDPTRKHAPGMKALPEGLTDEQKATLVGGGEVDTSLPNIFERVFGADGMFAKVGKKIFGEGGMFSKIGASLFGEGGMLSGLFGGGDGSGLSGFLGKIFGGATGVATGGVIGLANGGVAKYSAGGIARQPTYLVGEGKQHEAVVPLPNNRSIPVDLGNGSGATNNTSITVNMADGSSQTTSDGAAGLAQAIDAAVQSTIEKELRPGGILAG
jgi:hypothetical protein